MYMQCLPSKNNEQSYDKIFLTIKILLVTNGIMNMKINTNDNIDV
jgi:hypothetical protein